MGVLIYPGWTEVTSVCNTDVLFEKSVIVCFQW